MKTSQIPTFLHMALQFKVNIDIHKHKNSEVIYSNHNKSPTEMSGNSRLQKPGKHVDRFHLTKCPWGWHNCLQYLLSNIWDCMCVTDLFKFRWPKWCIYKSSYFHHQLGSIRLSHSCFCGCMSKVVAPSYFVSCIINLGKAGVLLLLLLRSLWCGQMVGYINSLRPSDAYMRQ